MKMFGHRRVKVTNGGCQKWVYEGSPLTTDAPADSRIYRAPDPDTSIRATHDYMLEVVWTQNNVGMVDLRDPPNLPQDGTQCEGHIPGGANIPWANAVNEADGTFKSVEEL